MPQPERPVLTLAPGDLIMCSAPHQLVTVLGSCVAVTMLHRSTGLAGMCHAMLPEQKTGPVGVVGAFRYLDRAIAHMVAWFDKHGVAGRQLEVKVFGGADVLGSAVPAADRPATVGAQNVVALARLLDAYQLTATRSSLGGRAGLKLFFDTVNGEVLVRRLPPFGRASDG